MIPIWIIYIISEFVYYEDNKIIAESINLRLFNLSIK